MAMITVILGDQTVGSHSIAHCPFVVGRDPSSDIPIENIGISRQHCRFTWDGKSFLVEDLKSSNGVLLNGEKVQQAPLKDGDEVRLGKFRLVFHQAAGEPPPPSKQEKPLADLLQEAVEPDKKAAPADNMKTFQMSAEQIRARAGAAASVQGQRAGDVAKSLTPPGAKSGSKLLYVLLGVSGVIILALGAALIVLLRR